MSASNWYRDLSEDQMKASRIARKAEYAKGLLNFPPNQKKTHNIEKQWIHKSRETVKTLNGTYENVNGGEPLTDVLRYALGNHKTY